MTNFNSHEKLLKDINSYIELLVEENKSLKQLLNDFRKDDEIQSLEQEIERLKSNSISIMSDKEKKETKKFSNEHFRKCKSNIKYIVESNGIGDVIKVQCKKCNEIKDVTDTSSW